ncbi:hypothetical protein J6C36_03940 [Methanocorpusculaceae archaeon]|nr:hypothetical protein [Methanocorpusculaceae archaeon]MBO5367662.1 hypothetical protein [Methanocorpusculum sp.]
MTSKPDEDDYEKLYLVSRLVYNGEIDAEKASAKLSAILGSPEVYNKIVFSMYAGMKNGRVFQQSGGDESVVYFLRRIAQDEGPEALEKALNAVYGYTGFKGSVGCPMPELEDACDALKVIYGIRSEE